MQFIPNYESDEKSEMENLDERLRRERTSNISTEARIMTLHL